MPDDRLFHKKLGHSVKVNQLSDIEEIAWHTYVHAADDFGVMRFSALSLMDHHDRLAKRSMANVQRMLERLRDVGLIVTFEHQARLYCCQLDWQDYQKVRYPLKTANPKIPSNLVPRCSRATRWLLRIWPGGKGKLATWQAPADFEPEGGSGSDGSSGNLPGILPGTFPETSGRSRASAPAGGVFPVPVPQPVPDPDPSTRAQGFVVPPSLTPTYVEEKAPALARRSGLAHVDFGERETEPASSDVPAALRDCSGADPSGPDDRRRGMEGAHQGPAGGTAVCASGAARRDRASDAGGRDVADEVRHAAPGAAASIAEHAARGTAATTGRPLALAAATSDDGIGLVVGNRPEPDQLTRLRAVVTAIAAGGRG